MTAGDCGVRFVMERRNMKKILAMVMFSGAVSLAYGGTVETDSLIVNGDSYFYGSINTVAANSEIIPTNGMKLYYNFDSNTVTNVVDQTGAGNNSTVLGPTYTTAGRKGGGYYFSGSGTQSTTNCLKVKPGAISAITTGTFSVWVKFTSANDHQILNGLDSAGVLGTQIRTCNEVLNPTLALGTGASSTWLISTSRCAVAQWTQLVFTWNRSSAQIYMNGMLIASTNDANNNCYIPANTNDFWIGRCRFPGTYDYQTFKGYMDDFRIYNAVLSSQQVYTAYLTAQSSGKFELNGAGLVVSNGISQVSGNATNSFSGRVGVGTNSPSTTLDVNGATTLRGSLNMAGNAVTNAPNLVLTNDSRNLVLSGLSRGSNWWVSGGKMGIGTANPTRALEVTNDAIRSSGSNAGLEFQDRSGAPFWQWYGNAGAARLWSGSSDVVVVSSGGLMGVGTNSPGARLDVNGDCKFRLGASYSAPLGDVPMGTYTNMP